MWVMVKSDVWRLEFGSKGITWEYALNGGRDVGSETTTEINLEVFEFDYVDFLIAC